MLVLEVLPLCVAASGNCPLRVRCVTFVVHDTQRVCHLTNFVVDAEVTAIDRTWVRLRYGTVAICGRCIHFIGSSLDIKFRNGGKALPLRVGRWTWT